MASDFYTNFLAGWQMGQQRIQNRRMDEQMRRAAEMETYQREQDRLRQEQEAEERQLRMETYKLQQQEAKLKFNQERLAAAGQEAAMRAEARQRQSMPSPTAAEMGIPEQPPEMGGPPAADIRMARPMEMMPSPTGGADVAMPALSAREMEAQDLAEQQKKMRQALGLFEAEESIKARYKAPQGPEVRGVTGGFVTITPEGKIQFTRTQEKETGGGGGVTPNQEAALVDKLSKNWQALSKDVRSMERQATIMDAGLSAAKKGNMAAGSQAVLVTFQKILDPTSVVRESEYARSAAGQAILARIEGAAQQLSMGGAGVPLGELQKFADLANEFVRRSKESLAGERSRISRVAERYKIPKDLIFSDEGLAAGPAETPKATHRWVPGSGVVPISGGQ